MKSCVFLQSLFLTILLKAILFEALFSCLLKIWWTVPDIFLSCQNLKYLQSFDRANNWKLISSWPEFGIMCRLDLKGWYVMKPNLIREEDFRIVDIDINLILSLYSGKYIKFNQRSDGECRIPYSQLELGKN